MNMHILKASAGTGKTWSLVEEYKRCLAAGFTPEQIVVVTYTRKAAAELKQRLRTGLLQTTDSTAYDRQAMANRIPQALIGTVHSVCSSLLSECALEAGFSPRVDVLDEESAAACFNAAIGPIAEHWESELGPLFECLMCPEDHRKTKTWRSVVQEMVATARTNGLDVAALKACGPASWASFKTLFPAPTADEKALDQQFKEALTDCKRNRPTPRPGKPLTKDTQTYLNAIDHLPEDITRIRWVDWFSLMNQKSGKAEATFFEELQNVLPLVYAHPRFHADVERLVTGLFNCAAHCLQQYADYKESRGLADFADLEHRFQLILGMPGVAERLVPRCKVLLVDEFQDTNPMQLAIFQCLRELAQETVWVGDPKQAIYGFRGADATLMDTVVAHFEQEGAQVDDLPTCRRTLQPLVDFTNAYFSEAFKKPLAVKAHRTQTGTLPTLHWWQILKKTKGSHQKERTAKAVARGIQDLLASDAQIFQGGENGEQLRPLLPDDVAVLCRDNSDCLTMANALEALGIRTRVARDGLLPCPEIQLIVSAWRLVLDGWDTLALAELLQLTTGEDWFGLALQDAGKTDSDEGAGDTSGTGEGLRQKLPLYPALEALRKRLSVLTPSELLDQLLALLVIPFSQMQSANLEALRGHVRAYEDACRTQGKAATHPGCLLSLMDMKPKQAEGGDNAVHVLTYHRAKGLEWPVVVLHSLDEKLRDSPLGLHTLSKDFDAKAPLAGRSLRYWPNLWGRSKPDWNLLAKPTEEVDQMTAKATAEDLRLLYVGMTRARDALILIGLEGDAMAWLRRSVALQQPTGNGELVIGNTAFPVVVQEFSTDESDETASPQPTAASDAPAVGVMPSGQKVTASVSANAETLVPASPDMPATPVKWTSHAVGTAIAVPKEARGTALGTALHAWFAVDLPRSESSEARLARAARHVALWHMPLAPEVLPELSDRLKTFMARHGTGTWRTEWPLAALEEGPTGSLCRQYSVDALLETPAGHHIIDHKTDFVETLSEKKLQTVVNAHAEQLLGYKSILEALGSTTKVWLYLALEGIVVEIED